MTSIIATAEPDDEGGRAAAAFLRRRADVSGGLFDPMDNTCQLPPEGDPLGLDNRLWGWSDGAEVGLLERALASDSGLFSTLEGAVGIVPDHMLAENPTLAEYVEKTANIARRIAKRLSDAINNLTNGESVDMELTHDEKTDLYGRGAALAAACAPQEAIARKAWKDQSIVEKLLLGNLWCLESAAKHGRNVDDAKRFMLPPDNRFLHVARIPMTSGAVMLRLGRKDEDEAPFYSMTVTATDWDGCEGAFGRVNIDDAPAFDGIVKDCRLCDAIQAALAFLWRQLNNGQGETA